jgi:hypothetical protein
MPKKIKEPSEDTENEMNILANKGEIPMSSQEELIPASTRGIVERELLSEIQAAQVEVQNSAVGMIRSEENVSMERSISGAVVAASNIEVEAGGAVAIVAGGDVRIHNGGGEVLVIGGDLEVRNGGGQVLVAGGNVQAHNAFVGVVVSPNVSLGEGSRVLLDTPRAIAFGAAFGFVFTLLNYIFKVKKANLNNG